MLCRATAVRAAGFSTPTTRYADDSGDAGGAGGAADADKGTLNASIPATATTTIRHLDIARSVTTASPHASSGPSGVLRCELTPLSLLDVQRRRD
jgi:hypothetical protein